MCTIMYVVKWFLRFYNLSLSQEMFACLLLKKNGIRVMHVLEQLQNQGHFGSPVFTCVKTFWRMKHITIGTVVIQLDVNTWPCILYLCLYVLNGRLQSRQAYKKIFQQSSWTIHVYMCLLGRIFSEGFRTWYSWLVLALKGHFPLHLFK